MPEMPPPAPPTVASGPPESPRSAVEALGPAWENTKRVLFQPFNLRKWFKLGLIAFLAGVMGGGGGPGGGPGGPGEPEQAWDQIVAWYQAHSAEIIIGAVVLGALVSVLWPVLLYVSSVFRFIFMESVITNETRIRDSWRRNKAQGLSFFLWRIGFGLAALLLIAVLVGGPIALILTSVGWRPGSDPPSGAAIAGSIGLVILAVVLTIIAAIIIGIVSAMTRDFVLPLMYVRRIRVLDAWREYWRVLCGNKMGVVIYFLMKLVVGFAAGIVSLFLGCFGLLIAMLPLAVIAGIGYVIVQAAGITSWSWTYLWGLIPAGIVIAIGLGYWMTCVMLPVPVYFQSYALKYLGYLEPEAATI